jgi:hypothetical protein
VVPVEGDTLNRVASLCVAFCGLALLYVVMKPGTEKFLDHIFPWWFKAFLTSLFQALFISLTVFGVLGVFAAAGVNLIARYPISFVVVCALGTALFLRANTATAEFGY